MACTRVIERSKKNICGLRTRTATLNFTNAINDTDKNEGGIPMSRVAEVLTIMRTPLSDEQYDYTRHGFGLGTERITQQAIAEMYKVKPNYVSRVLHEARDILWQPKYKKQFNALIPTQEDYDSAFRIDTPETAPCSQDDFDDLVNRLVKDNNTINWQKSAIAERDAKIADLEEKLRIQQEESATLRKQLTTVEDELAQSKRRCNAISNNNVLLKTALAEIGANVDSFRSTCETIRRLGSEITLHRLEELFKDDLLDVLYRVGIYDLVSLCKNSEKNLIDLKVSKKFVDIIKAKLEGIGMHLRET